MGRALFKYRLCGYLLVQNGYTTADFVSLSEIIDLIIKDNSKRREILLVLELLCFFLLRHSRRKKYKFETLWSEHNFLIYQPAISSGPETILANFGEVLSDPCQTTRWIVDWRNVPYFQHNCGTFWWKMNQDIYWGMCNLFQNQCYLCYNRTKTPIL